MNLFESITYQNHMYIVTVDVLGDLLGSLKLYLIVWILLFNMLHIMASI